MNQYLNFICSSGEIDLLILVSFNVESIDSNSLCMTFSLVTCSSICELINWSRILRSERRVLASSILCFPLDTFCSRAIDPADREDSGFGLVLTPRAIYHIMNIMKRAHIHHQLHPGTMREVPTTSCYHEWVLLAQSQRLGQRQSIQASENKFQRNWTYRLPYLPTTLYAYSKKSI